MIELTESAIRKTRALLEAKGDASYCLRLMVRSGGCSGMEYQMHLDQEKPGDLRLGSEDARVLVDAQTMDLVRGSVLDFDDGLRGTGFQVRNPLAKETCGCGRSFQA
jgi:iron-sulfur cluster assembly accessory protein